MKDSSNPVQEFIVEKCIIGLSEYSKSNPCKVLKTELYESFVGFQKSKGETKPWKQNRFARAMHSNGLNLGEWRDSSGDRHQYYTGIRLRGPYEDAGDNDDASLTAHERSSSKSLPTAAPIDELPEMLFGPEGNL